MQKHYLIAISLRKDNTGRHNSRRKLFNTTQIQQTESATKYIKRFRNAKLLAKSVGVEIEETTLIDKFLMSMSQDRRYGYVVRSFQTQRRHENLTPNYALAKLTMTEIESHLYAVDENSRANRNMANQTKSFDKNSIKSMHNNRKKTYVKRDLSEVTCYNCGKKGHISPNCPEPKKPRSNYPKKSDSKVNSASSKNITLLNNTNANAQANMANLSNVGRKRIDYVEDVPLVHDLYNWVMDSGATCHMTPYKSDFLPETIRSVNKVVEVADGHTVPATLCGKVLVITSTDLGQKINLRIEDVLLVPNLERRLFSLMSLIEQDHDVRLSRNKGVQIYFSGERSPVTIPMPNYHLFASSASANENQLIKREKKNKKKISLDLIYQRMGCRSIKTLLSANQAEIWNDVEIIMKNDIISTSDHDIATIRKRKRNMHTEPDPNLQPGQKLCLDIIKSPHKISVTQETSYPYYLLAVDAFSRLPKMHGLFNINTDSIISALQYIRTQLLHIKKDTNVLLTDRIQSDFGSVFTSEKFQQYCLHNQLKLTLAAPKHLEMNSILERTFQSICLIKNTLIVQARVDESFTHFALLFACHIFSSVPVKTLRKNGKLTTPYELFTNEKPNIQNLRVLFCPVSLKNTQSIHKMPMENFKTRRFKNALPKEEFVVFLRDSMIIHLVTLSFCQAPVRLFHLLMSSLMRTL